MPGEPELAPCVRPEPDPATLEPMPEPLTAEEYHREVTADLMAHIGVIDPAPGWPHHLQDAPVKSVLDQLDAGDGRRHFSPMVRVRVTDGITSDPVQTRIDAWRCGPDGSFDARAETPWELQNRGWTRADGDGVWGLVTWLHRRGADPDLEDERSWIHVGVRAPGYHSEYRRVLLLDPQRTWNWICPIAFRTHRSPKQGLTPGRKRATWGELLLTRPGRQGPRQQLVKVVGERGYSRRHGGSDRTVPELRHPHAVGDLARTL